MLTLHCQVVLLAMDMMMVLMISVKRKQVFLYLYDISICDDHDDGECQLG